MAKKNVRDEPLKPQVSENEQMSDIVFILDKMELILQAVSKIGKDGKYSTVPADKEHSNSFLKIDRITKASYSITILPVPMSSFAVTWTVSNRFWTTCLAMPSNLQKPAQSA